MECGDRDNFGRDTMHDWVMANENMAKVLAEKDYHYKFVFAHGAGHTDRPTISELYPTALQWVWQDYPITEK
jgi:enterochelin esterase family protein